VKAGAGANAEAEDATRTTAKDRIAIFIVDDW
jgi:hypothetical protein